VSRWQEPVTSHLPHGSPRLLTKAHGLSGLFLTDGSPQRTQCDSQPTHCTPLPYATFVFPVPHVTSLTPDLSHSMITCLFLLTVHLKIPFRGIRSIYDLFVSTFSTPLRRLLRHFSHIVQSCASYRRFGQRRTAYTKVIP
jgi:hypothetical protein